MNRLYVYCVYLYNIQNMNRDFIFVALYCYHDYLYCKVIYRFLFYLPNVFERHDAHTIFFKILATLN